MIRCSLCRKWLARDPFCSDLAVITCHWITRHWERWSAANPEAAAILSESRERV